MKGKNKKFALIAAVISCAVLTFAACGKTGGQGGGGGGTNTTATVTVSQAMNIDLIDGAVQIPFEKDGDGTIDWSSNKTTVATVDQQGKVSGVGAGIAKITAKLGASEAVCSVTVTKIYGNYDVITTAAEFKAMEFSDAEKYYCLGADIDFAGEALAPLGGWDAAVAANQFNATLDGRGYALKNFKLIDNPPGCLSEGNLFGVSLFPRLQNGTIRNLNIIGVDYSGFGFTGGIVGIVENGTIENCFAQGKINATDGFGSTVPAGGIAGIMGGGATVKNCLIDLQILGGFIFAGFNFGSGDNCYAVSSHIGDRDGDLAMQIDKTTNPAETPALKRFTDSARIEDASLSDRETYDLGKRWSMSEGYMAYITCVDGTAPSWALIR